MAGSPKTVCVMRYRPARHKKMSQKIASTMRRTGHLRGRPRRKGGGNRQRTRLHSSSLRSLGYVDIRRQGRVGKKQQYTRPFNPFVSRHHFSDPLLNDHFSEAIPSCGDMCASDICRQVQRSASGCTGIRVAGVGPAVDLHSVGLYAVGL